MNKVGRIQKVIVLSGMVMVGVVASVFGQTEDEFWLIGCPVGSFIAWE